MYLYIIISWYSTCNTCRYKFCFSWFYYYIVFIKTRVYVKPCVIFFFSGGDPLHTKNRDEILNIVKEIKQKFPKKDVWLYTGYTWEKIKHLDIVNYIDILVDGKFEQDLHNPDLHWKGSSNQRVIDVKKTLKNNQIVIHC